MTPRSSLGVVAHSARPSSRKSTTCLYSSSALSKSCTAWRAWSAQALHGESDALSFTRRNAFKNQALHVGEGVKSCRPRACLFAPDSDGKRLADGGSDCVRAPAALAAQARLDCLEQRVGALLFESLAGRCFMGD